MAKLCYWKILPVLESWWCSLGKGRGRGRGRGILAEPSTHWFLVFSVLTPTFFLKVGQTGVESLGRMWILSCLPLELACRSAHHT